MERGSSNDFTDLGFSSSRTSMCDVLRSLVISNIEFFDGDKTTSGKNFADVFSRFLINLNDVEHQANEVARFAHEYDFDPSIPGNGYRGMVSVVDSCVQQSIQLCRAVCLKRSTFMFRREHFFKEVESYCDLMNCLLVILRLMHRFRQLSEPQQLFPANIDSSIEFIAEADNIDTTCFYGRCLGFQFHDSLKSPLKFISLMMASFSDAYYNTGGMITRTASSVISCGKYMCSPELRAERIVEVARKASVDFCKSFWLLQEHQLLQQVPGLVGVSLQVNKVLRVPTQPLKLETTNGTFVDIPVPQSHLPPSPVICRLLSSSLRQGQVSEEELRKVSGKLKPPSPYLIIQCHGGGFVAQSSKSHEVYLRDWCSQLDVPFLCIDYSLAPDARYPRPLEECFYAYAWAVKNCAKLGSTGETICVVGDSAGGNLLTGVIMKSIELGIRVPDGFLSIYTPFLLDFVPSPSRMLCLMDPLLPFGFMLRCIRAYGGHPSNGTNDLSGDELCHSESIGFASGESSDESCVNVSTEFTDSVIENEFADDTVLTVDPEHVDNQCHDKALADQQNLYNESRRSHANSLNAMCDSSSRSSFEEVAASDLDTLELKSTPGSMDAKVHTKMITDGTEDGEREGKIKSDDYVSVYMDWYKLEDENGSTNAKLRAESTDVDENVLFEMPVEFPFRLSKKMSKLTDRVVNSISGIFGKGNDSTTASKHELLAKRKKSYNGIFADRSLDDSGSLVALMEEFKKFAISKEDPYLSPYYASEDILRKFPPVTFFCATLDPCLDDSVVFSKKLRKLGCKVNIEVVDHVPHGFLNLLLVSKDAQDGSDLCVKHLRRLLNITENGELQNGTAKHL